ncbi:MAG: carbohydrate ABC transporter permease [Treponema sp.]|jgi:raffinose/stachyose/melibiose transport system permease protein|nr:carbohydrate ABC transporter permease [Treponema sp.]
MRSRDLSIKTVNAAVVYLFSFLVIVPVLVMILGSFKTSGEALKFDLSLPKKFMFSNYLFVLDRGGIPLAFANSLAITVAAAALTISSTALCAFYIARAKTKMSSFLGNVFSIGLVAPFQIITTFALLKLLNLIGSYAGVILIYCAIQTPWSMYMFIQFVKSIPRDMDEAAYIDGAKPMTMFFRIILPLLKPVTATTTVMVVINVWNDFMLPLYFLDSSKKWTMPLTVYNFFGQYFSDWNYVFADLVLTALPIALLYLYFQKYVIAGITSGAIKG